MGSRPAHELAARVDSCTRGMVSGPTACLFEELGLHYIGPVDGHSVEDLVLILRKVKELPAPGPVLIHVITEKGKGYAPAEVAPDKMHGGSRCGSPKASVRFALDRAGLVGADGPTHCGAFDTTSWLVCQTWWSWLLPAKLRLMHMVATAAAIDDRPSCFRYPRGNGVGSILPSNNKGNPRGGLLRARGPHHRRRRVHRRVQLSCFHFLGLNGLLDGKLKWRAMILPDRYIDHGAQADQIEEAGLTSRHIASTVLSLIDKSKGHYSPSQLIISFSSCINAKTVNGSSESIRNVPINPCK
ncbi:unnamed protein product [Thlaspi arvense]|uniref:Transketolase-like pyrimidine-binding domain-containing protein n=1 Tax=Thlaspi arvense TaxID=13288 RepID=A0AAU9RTM7_THLAR|nr:unnamed protein product [Thlaspi arvense]